jgi:AcrR family transcriptional regulator
MTGRSCDRPVSAPPARTVALEEPTLPTATWHNLDPAKRERVLRAAMAEFGRHGFSSGSLNVIAREAGVAKGSLFVYFDDKLDLYATTCETCSSRIRALMEEAIAVHAAATDGLFDLLRRLLPDWIAHFRAHPLDRGVTLATNFEMDPDVRGAVRAVVNRHYREVLGPLLAEARVRGELRDDADPDHLLALLVLLLPHLALAPFTPELDPVLGLYGAEDLSDPVEGLLGALERAFATAATRSTSLPASPARSPA